MPAKYEIQFNKRYLKDLEKIHPSAQQLIRQQIEALGLEPRPNGCKKLKSQTDLYRIRCGDYRVAYQIQDRVLLVIVIEVGHRKEIYR